jgi:lipid-A-disaccharide synthase
MTPDRPGLSIHLVAGEESGDLLGAALMRALRRQAGALHLGGLGGRAMAAEGLASPFAIDELSLIGIAAIPRRLPVILRRIRETAAAVVSARPDLLVIIDSPDFTHRVARRVRAADRSIAIVDYVSPSVWAWRPSRARAMRHYVDHVLAILPFEPEVHARLGGPPCTYVGHPLSERTGDLRPNEQERDRRLTGPPVVLVLPGSRGSELSRLLDIFARAIDLTAERVGPLELVLPTVPHLADRVRAATAAWRHRPRVVTEPDEKNAAFRVARAALAKSGTVTLELAIAGVPMVTAYRISAFEAFIARRVIHVPSVILANLVLGENVVPEFLQEACTPERLAEALVPLIEDTPARRRQVDAFARLDRIMQIGTLIPSTRAAEMVLALAERAQKMSYRSAS